MIPMVGVGFKYDSRRTVLSGVQPDGDKGIRAHQGDLVLDRRMPLNQGEMSGAPRARSVDDSPMTLAATPLL